MAVGVIGGNLLAVRQVLLLFYLPDAYERLLSAAELCLTVSYN